MSNEDVPEVDLRVVTPPGGAQLRKLRFTYTAGEMEDFVRDFGMDAETSILRDGLMLIFEEERKAIEEHLVRVRRRRERLRRYQKKCKKRQRANRKQRAGRGR